MSFAAVGDRVDLAGALQSASSTSDEVGQSFNAQSLELKTAGATTLAPARRYPRFLSGIKTSKDMQIQNIGAGGDRFKDLVESMVPWLTGMFDHTALLRQYAILAAVLFVATLVISLAVASDCHSSAAIRLLFLLAQEMVQGPGHGLVLSRWCRPVKNLFGAVLVVLGIILSVPGLPGQGLLTVVAGLFLLDFPGKRSLLYKLVSRPLLLRSINRLRTKFSRPPLVVGQAPGPREP